MSKFSAAERDSILSESRRLIANGNAAAIRRQIDETALAWRTRERQEPRIVHRQTNAQWSSPSPSRNVSRWRNRWPAPSSRWWEWVDARIQYYRDELREGTALRSGQCCGESVGKA